MCDKNRSGGALCRDEMFESNFGWGVLVPDGAVIYRSESKSRDKRRKFHSAGGHSPRDGGEDEKHTRES
jgi:hypothetical protein